MQEENNPASWKYISRNVILLKMKETLQPSSVKMKDKDYLQLNLINHLKLFIAVFLSGTYPNRKCLP